MKYVYFLCLALLNFIYVQSQIKGEMTDPRDSMTYATVTYENIIPNGISMTWFCWDLRFVMDGSHEHKKGFGIYYTWEAALSACPEGWHLPSFGEWDILISKYGGVKDAKKYLISPGWYEYEETGNSMLWIDNHGCLKSPFYEHRKEINHDISYHWTSTSDDEEKAWFIELRSDYKGVGIKNYKKIHAMNVRCVKDF